MTFARPEMLALAPLLALAVGLGVIAQWRRGRRLVEAFGGARAGGRLGPPELASFPRGRLAALCGASVLLTVSASGPTPTEPPSESESPIDVVVLLDVSWSMSADDAQGTRAARAREVVRRISEGIPDERIGLTLFADWPYTLVPVTDDLDLVRYFGSRASPDLVASRDQGTGLGTALGHAAEAVRDRLRPEAQPAIVLVSDGESYGDPAGVLESVTAMRDGGVRVWTAGIGSTSGTPLTEPGSAAAPLVDEAGSAIVSAMDAGFLSDIAAAGGGSFHDVTTDAGLRSLVRALGGTAADAREDRPPPNPVFWLTLLALPLLLWEATADTPHRRALLRRERLA